MAQMKRDLDFSNYLYAPDQDPEADGGADAISPVSAKTARKVATGKKGKNKPDSGKGKDKGNGDSQLASRFTTSDTAPRIATPAGRSLTGETGGGAMTAGAALAAANASMQADAPACDACGTITVRSGTCYKCLNCGASMGCS